MKKVIGLLVVVVLVVIGVIYYFNAGEEVLKVGATPVPHAELLELIREDFEKETGATLEIVEFNDYVQPNLALDDGSIDANFFQHIPYLESFSQNQGLEGLISVAKIHVEPMGFYVKSDEIRKGDTVVIPNDTTNEGRALILLENNGLITLEEEEKLSATIQNIVKNPLNLEFVELDAAYLPRTYKEDDTVNGGVINTNYAIQADLNPLEDALYIEGSESPYANIVAVKEENKENELIISLIDYLQSEKVSAYINDKYEGAVVPVF
ncbi:MAG: MetQ/NlpA family ABC transporter substrate-binding protein [Thermotogota bacterium]